jgi:hypothetical protein
MSVVVASPFGDYDTVCLGATLFLSYRGSSSRTYAGAHHRTLAPSEFITDYGTTGAADGAADCRFAAIVHVRARSERRADEQSQCRLSYHAKTPKRSCEHSPLSR